VTTIQALAARLVSESVASAQRVFYGNRATLPTGTSVAFVTLQATGGYESTGTHNDGVTKYRKPTFQVVARAGTYDSAEALANAAYAALTFQNATVSGVAFLRVRPLQEPFELPLDTDQRCRVAFNVIAEHAE
jgi:hypothetical protein